MRNIFTSMQIHPTRRRFLEGSLGCAIGASRLTKAVFGQTTEPVPLRMFKSLKWGMIDFSGTVLEKFQLCKELGYDGMELISPAKGLAVHEVRAASEQLDMPVHGVVDMKHWKIRLSSPKAQERELGVDILRQAIKDAHSFGGDSVLLVPGKVTGNNENHDHVWHRSIAGIRKVLPLASRLGIRVLVENVWNGFCETPEELRDYLDEIDSPWVGAYFDIGNVVKFSPSPDWIRILGNRIVKLDIKDWGKNNGFCKIGDGDVNWPAVREALVEINFTGWCTAEVAGGGRERLAEISSRMNNVLALK